MAGAFKVFDLYIGPEIIEISQKREGTAAFVALAQLAVVTVNGIINKYGSRNIPYWDPAENKLLRLDVGRDCTYGDESDAIAAV